MGENITIVIGLRNREINRVENCLRSLNSQEDKDFKTLIIDYGSAGNFSDEVRQLIKKFSFCEYIYVETQGHFWNRAHALNIGIKLSKTEYTITSDIDLIYPPNFIQTLKKHLSPKREIHFSANDLPRNFSKWESLFKTNKTYGKVREKTALGLVQCVKTSLLKEIHGFDEFYCIWGAEDEDLNERLQKQDIETLWVDAKWPIYHQWHESSLRTNNLPPRWQEYFVHYKMTHSTDLKRNDKKWGNLISRAERPALKYITTKKRVDKIHLEKEPTQLIFNKLENRLKKVKQGTVLHFIYSDPFKKSMEKSKLKKFLKVVNHALNSINSPILLTNDLNYFKKHQSSKDYWDVFAYFILLNRNKFSDYYLVKRKYHIELIITK